MKSSFVFVDIEIDSAVDRRSLAAEFVNATDTRYSFSSSSLQLLGGSEVKRINDYYENDHDFSEKGRIDANLPTTNTSRIVIRTFDEMCPLATENFKRLCQGNGGLVGESGKAQTYDGCVVHRVQSEFVVQTGDFVFGNGSGGESVFGKKFKDEKNGLTIKHDRRGLVSMGNSGKNSNTSQFFITFAALPQCDGKHVVFGEVVAGFEVLNLIEQIAGSADGNPKVGVKVFKAGLWNKSMPAAGYWMRVPDNCFSGSTPVFFAFPRVLVVAPTEAATLKFRSALQSTCVCVVETLVVSSEKVGETLEETAKTRGHAYDYILLAPAFQEEQIGSFEGIRMGFSKPLVGEVGPLVWEAFKEWKLDPRAL